jgi:ectoine hydroxylase-related dioxygenase (phytanoyl-CoA dioxygenase family)
VFQGLGLTRDERRAWEEDGFFLRPAALAAAEVALLREAAEDAAALVRDALEGAETYAIDGNRYVEAAGSTVQLEHRHGTRTLRVLEPFHHLHPRFDALIDDPRIVEPMRELVGSDDVALFTDKLNLKRPREGSRFRWHQDSLFWVHACDHVDRLPNVMLAIDDASPDNGCLRVVRGSHRHGLLPGCEGDGVLGPFFTNPRYVREEDQVPAVMPAGSLLFFSPHTVHGSEPNHSASERRALVLTYQPGGHPMFKFPATRVAGSRASLKALRSPAPLGSQMQGSASG